MSTPDETYNPGAQFTISDINYALRFDGFPVGTVFEFKGKRATLVSNGYNSRGYPLYKLSPEIIKIRKWQK